jgi:hypothetical protein
MTIDQLALATAGFVIFLILILLSSKQRFDKQLRRMQSELNELRGIVNELRGIEARRFAMTLNPGKSVLVPPGNDTATVGGRDVIPLVPAAAQR